MAKYYMDCEFLEGPQQKYFLGMPWGKTKPTIDLISIGVYCEDGRKYYAISKDFNVREAWDRFQYNNDGKKEYWIRNNVLFPIWEELVGRDYERLNGHPVTNTMIDLTWDLWPDDYNEFNYYTFKTLIDEYGKSKTQIVEEIQEFLLEYNEGIELYGYYSAFDMVVFTWLHGTMMDLPERYPIYCHDLGAWKESFIDRKQTKYGNFNIPIGPNDFTRGNLMMGNKIEQHPDYPQNPGEHNAMNDAVFNYYLHRFLEKYDRNDW